MPYQEKTCKNFWNRRIRSDFRDAELGCYVAVRTVFQGGLFYRDFSKIAQKQQNIFWYFYYKNAQITTIWKYRMKVSGGTIRLFRLYHRLVKTCSNLMLKPHAQKLLILNKNVRFDSKYTWGGIWLFHNLQPKKP